MQDTPGIGDGIYQREWSCDSGVPMGEDCLYLNIWTPANSLDDNLPVLVWYFGGDDGGAVTVPYIVLHDKYGTEPALLGTDDRTQVRIINITASDLHGNSHSCFLSLFCYGKLTSSSPHRDILPAGMFPTQGPSPDRDSISRFSGFQTREETIPPASLYAERLSALLLWEKRKSA